MWKSAFFILVMLSVTACGPASRDPKARETTFSTDDIPKPAGDPERTTTITEAARVAPLVFKDKKDVAPPEYVVPDRVREKLKEARPDLAARAADPSFDFLKPNLSIDVKGKTMRFTGELRRSGAATNEAMELKCMFDPAQVPWTCNLFPSDEKIAAERRIQGTVNCLDTYRCSTIGIELFVVVNGQTKSRLFQSEPFAAYRAESGDLEDAEYVAPKDEPKDKPKVFEKPTREGKFQDRLPVAETPLEVDERAEDEDVTALLEDPDAAVELVTPMAMPAPAAEEKYSIPGIAATRPAAPTTVANQAINRHNSGRLNSARALPMSGQGFMCRFKDERNYGTDLMIERIQTISQTVARNFPGRSPLVIANISSRTGGPMCSAAGNCHASHQTGLDADIVFPSKKSVREMWAPCETRKVQRTYTDRQGRTRTRTSTVCRDGAGLSNDFDSERFWAFLKGFTCGGDKPVLAMFLDKEIKRHMCKYARSIGESVDQPGSCAFRALQALKHETGHFDHVHVRLHCPGNRDCRNATVSLARTSGCP